MPYYLAPYVEERDQAHGGRRVIRAVGYEGQPGAACLHLWTRAGTDARCLLRLPTAHADPRLEKLAEAATEVLTPALLAKTRAALGVTELRATRLGAVFGELMLSPFAGKWKGLLPSRGRYELWLGGELLWLGPRVIAGGATDSFTRADETPIAAPWVKLTGSTGDINLVSNAIQASATGDKFYYRSGAASGADQYSQFLATTQPTSNDWGPACRIGENGFSGYIATPFTSAPTFMGFDAGNFFDLADLTAGFTGADGATHRLEVEGTTLRAFKDVVQATGSPTTDATLTGAGNGVGVFLFQTGGTLDDFDGADLGGAAAQTITPASIGSAEAFGTPRSRLYIVPVAITSAEAVAAPRLVLRVVVGAIAGAEAFGTPRLALQVVATGIVSAEAVGTAKVNLTIPITGIATGEAFGSPGLNLRILGQAIASAEVFGTAALQKTGAIAVPGIPSAEAFGAAELDLHIRSTGIGTGEVVGTLRLQLGITPSGIVSAEALGTPRLNLSVRPIGVNSAEVFGTVTLTGGAAGVVLIRLTGELFTVPTIDTETFGVPTIRDETFTVPTITAETFAVSG